MDCPLFRIGLNCFSQPAVAKSSTQHDPEAVHVNFISAFFKIFFVPAHGITDYTVLLPTPVHGLAVNVIVPSTIGTHTNDCQKSGVLEVTGTIPPSVPSVTCGLIMDVYPLDNIAGGNVPRHEGGSNANGGNANGGNVRNANGGNANSGDEGDNSG